MTEPTTHDSEPDSSVAKRRPVRVLVPVLAGVALVAAGYALAWHMKYGPDHMFTYGPFTGRARPDAPVGVPAQRFPIYGGLVLYVYDPRPKDEAPTVQLRDRDGRVLWCVYASFDEARVRNNLIVHRIRFTGTTSFPFWGPRVAGQADWEGNGPHEPTIWSIDDSGRLHGYWYVY